MMNSITEWYYVDKDGSHRATTVGASETNDMWSYLHQLYIEKIVWDVTQTYIGEDI